MAKTGSKTKAGSAEPDMNGMLIDSVYISPLTDFGFKRLFYNSELLIPFLNDIVGMDIKTVEYKSTEGLGWFFEERTAVFDLLCTTNKEEQFVVEMQLGQQTFFRDRALFYGSHVIRRQAPRRKNWNFNLKPVYIVSVLNFNIFRDEASKDRVIERVYLYRESAGERFSDKFQMIFVQLPKFGKALRELESSTDNWLFLLKNAERLKSCPPEITGEPFKLFLEIAEIKKLTPEDMNRYEVSLEKSYQMRNIANFARMEGMMEGRMEGRMEGLMEGEMKGMKKGITEKSQQIAVKLLMRGETVDDIVSITELTREQVTALLSQLPKV